MSDRNKLHFEFAGLTMRLASVAGLLLTAALAPTVLASENVAQAPFAYWADVPPAGQFVLGMVYEQSKSYHMYASGQHYNIKVKCERRELRH